MPGMVRSDALPEFHIYTDDGCEHHPACLACTLDRCRFDVAGGIRVLRNVARDLAIIREHRRERLPVEVLAHRHGISKRSVFRILQAAKQVA
jgi:hypothetical protein